MPAANPVTPPLSSPETVLADATALAKEPADGPTFASAMTGRMLETEWAMTNGKARREG